MSGVVAVAAGGVRMVRDSPDAAFTHFAAEHGPRLVRLATLLTGSREDGEDAVQEAMVALARAWPRVRADTAPAYARTAVVRKAVDVLRRRRETAVDVLPEGAADDPALLRYEEDRAFLDRLRVLPERQRAVLVLRYWADLDDRAIGRALHCTPSTVRSQAARALARLREPELRP